MGHYGKLAVHESKKFFEHLVICFKWVLISMFTGVVIGLISTAFAYGLTYATSFRTSHKYIIIAVPLAGLLITFLYEKFGSKVSRGTNMALAAINSDEEIPIIMLPLIFVSTIISHLFGASVGREGAALQMGASFGNAFAKVLKLNENDKKVLIMTGMSAAFSALFGTPLAATIFSMEVVSVGVMYYAALVPCVVSSITAISLAKSLGVTYATYHLMSVPEFTPYTIVMTVVLGILFALVSIMLCTVLTLTERGFMYWIKNPYVRTVAAGLLIVVFSFVSKTGDYNGLGSNVIAAALTGNAVWYAFILKMILTSVSLAGGYKGGEIVPVLFIGATFGCAFGDLLGMSPAFCAALGMVAVFCGVTNTPIASLIIGIEMFGLSGLWFFCISIALSYMLSGYFGLYNSQLILYSKYRSVYVRKKTRR